ncbi:NAD-dependent epimerase/dehydratase family protein [Flavobacterium sp. HBTb2-11-1]|uniref:NAD-dependent epimerase/dehydratase family protein n=1 Tax=Flavobacterium sp. HBTb2-11-1 TaxID=2692212 RepID=UPI0013698E7D|nr:NAD-dependent epimerase/dehydratase family protein [Flavobacterium sp. HBTb2-11-1]MXO06020.1 NAD-dependent epimerase/dehydratase family protein [Flavobacterium sp. HBTb2-11-1]
MKTILITGGAGNVGSAMASKLAEDASCQIVIIDNLSTGNVNKIPKRENIVFIKADANNYNDIVPIFGRYNFDFVFHYAAVVGVKRTLENPILVLNDIEGIKNILSLSKNSGVKRVFYSSSSEVYGEPFEIPQNEKTTPLNSRLPYAIVKNIGEAFFRSYYQEYGLEYTIFRFFNTYGPNQSEDFVVPRFVKAALKNEPIYLYGDGLQTRSFCYVEDNIDTCIKALMEDKCVNDVLNVGSDIEIAILDLAQKIITITNSKSEIIYLPALEEGDMLRRCPDTTKMKALLGRELISLENGIKKLVEYYENRN